MAGGTAGVDWSCLPAYSLLCKPGPQCRVWARGSYCEIGQLQGRVIRGKEHTVKMSYCCTTVPAEVFLGCLIDREEGRNGCFCSGKRGVLVNFLQSQFFCWSTGKTRLNTMKLLVFHELVSSIAFYGVLGGLAVSGVFPTQKNLSND